MQLHNIIPKGRIPVLICLMLLSFAQSATAQVNLVVNGGFDTSASGWTITNVSGGGGYLSSAGDPAGSVLLYNPASPNLPTASQEINSLVPGQLYIVSGDYSGEAQNHTNNSFGVALDGVFLFQTAAPADKYWHSFDFDYTATSSSALLSLSVLINGPDYAYYIDNIAMEAIPEPSAWSLIFLGSSLFIFVRKTYRRVAQTRLLPW